MKILQTIVVKTLKSNSLIQNIQVQSQSNKIRNQAKASVKSA
jgi:hypothetical protein